MNPYIFGRKGSSREGGTHSLRAKALEKMGKIAIQLGERVERNPVQGLPCKARKSSEFAR